MAQITELSPLAIPGQIRSFIAKATGTITPPADNPTPGTLVAQFIAGTGETFSGTELTNWQDQSGNGYDASNTGISGPSDESATTRLIWDVELGRDNLGHWHGTTGYMNLDASHDTELRNCLWLFVVRVNNSGLHQSADFAMTSKSLIGWDASTMLWGWDAKKSLAIFQDGDDSYGEVPAFTITSSPIVMGFYGAATEAECRFIHGERLIPSVGLPNDVTKSGGTLGRGIGASWAWNQSMYEAVHIKDIALADVDEWVKHLQEKYTSGWTGKTKAMAIVGDSIVAGEPLYPTNSTVIEQLSEDCPDWHLVSAAINGQTLGTLGVNQINVQITDVAELMNASVASNEYKNPITQRLLLIAGGTNDINGGDDYATVNAALIARITEAQATGATLVGVCSIIDNMNFTVGERVVADSINADILDLTSGLGHDFFVNLHQTSAGGNDLFDDNTSNLFEDGIHLSLLGRDEYVRILKAKMTAIALDYGEFCVKENQVYVPGPTAEEVYVPGAAAEQIGC